VHYSLLNLHPRLLGSLRAAPEEARSRSAQKVRTAFQRFTVSVPFPYRGASARVWLSKNGLIWRRERDSNPRRAFDPYTLSRGAPSTTRPSLRSVGKLLRDQVVTRCTSHPAASRGAMILKRVTEGKADRLRAARKALIYIETNSAGERGSSSLSVLPSCSRLIRS
jgi:hypothetical protein